MNLLKRFTDKNQAFRVAKQAGLVQELAELRSKSNVNTYLSPKERDRRATRKKMAKQSRKRNRG